MDRSLASRQAVESPCRADADSADSPPGSPRLAEGRRPTPPIDLPTLERARRLALFLLRNESLALEVTAAALTRVETMAARQERRSAYRPKKQRSKVFFSSAQLLQNLIYRESEFHEMYQESSGGHGFGGLGRDGFLIRYVEHLVRISIWRNSFHVTLALCKFLYRYSTQETLAIYDLVSQDPECRLCDHYCRARKRVLLKEIESRFGASVARCRGQRGEALLRCGEASRRAIDLIRECLDRFTPWQTRCVIPSGLDLRRDELPDLRRSGEVRDRATCREADRIHAVLHPACFSRLTRALGLDPPERRLAVPHFEPAALR